MACKYYKSNLFNDYCTSRGKDEKVTYAHTRTYCQDSSWFEKCPAYKEASSSECFITTACITALGCQDDGYELTVLRSFRDGWLKFQPGGEDAVRSYYQMAPKIVETINASPDSAEVYEGIFRDFIQHCVNYVEAGENETALHLYKKMVETLAERYLER